jgi:hypothetical protein
MALRSKLFANDRALEACATQDSAHVTTGAVGSHVAKIQTALRLLDGAQIDGAELSGKRYGRSTAAAVLAYKTKRGIINRAYQSKPDDIVGKMTIAALDQEMFARENDPQLDTDEVCCNGDPFAVSMQPVVAQQFAEQLSLQPGAALANAPSGALGFVGAVPASFSTFSLLSHFKPISAPQIAVATPVFGSSIDFRFVFLSDFKGASGRAFTIVVAGMAVMNCGTFTPSNDKLIHELVHVWQSQHHSKPAAFIENSVKSQALAVTENEALALIDPTLKANPRFPSQFPRSPYACITGKPFSEYAAEQIAKQVERNFLAGAGTPVAIATDPIVAHIKAVGPRGVDADNVTGLTTARTEDKRTTGALF